MSHEIIHLLNPLPTRNGVKVCSLDEGIAVKFAEKIYKAFISPYTNALPKNSPTILVPNQYNTVYQAVVKIPDGVLRQVRNTLGAFHSITDFEGLKSIVEGHVSESEAELLFSQFAYPK